MSLYKVTTVPNKYVFARSRAHALDRIRAGEGFGLEADWIATPWACQEVDDPDRRSSLEQLREKEIYEKSLIKAENDKHKHQAQQAQKLAMRCATCAYVDYFKGRPNGSFDTCMMTRQYCDIELTRPSERFNCGQNMRLYQYDRLTRWHRFLKRYFPPF